MLLPTELLANVFYLSQYWCHRVGTIHRPTPYQDVALPLSYGGMFGGNGKSRTFTAHRMKVLHYHYATLPYRNTLYPISRALVRMRLILAKSTTMCFYMVGAQGLEP